MTDYREINKLQRDLPRARRLAELLLAIVGMEWTTWEVSFLESIIRQVDQRLEAKDKDPLTTRQAEILAELWEESVPYERPDGFSIPSLLNDCFGMRHLLNDDEVEFIDRHRTTGPTKLRRRQVNFLFHCARKAFVIEPYQGWKPAPVDDAA
jgi:hypothetical protein